MILQPLLSLAYAEVLIMSEHPKTYPLVIRLSSHQHAVLRAFQMYLESLSDRERIESGFQFPLDDSHVLFQSLVMCFDDLTRHHHGVRYCCHLTATYCRCSDDGAPGYPLTPQAYGLPS